MSEKYFSKMPAPEATPSGKDFQDKLQILVVLFEAVKVSTAMKIEGEDDRREFTGDNVVKKRAKTLLDSLERFTTVFKQLQRLGCSRQRICQTLKITEEKLAQILDVYAAMQAEQNRINDRVNGRRNQIKRDKAKG